MTLPPIIEWDFTLSISQKEREFIYKKAIPVSDARRDGLWAAEEGAPALLEKAGLAGANILCLFVPFKLGVKFEEGPALALSKSVVKYKKGCHAKHSEYTHCFLASWRL